MIEMRRQASSERLRQIRCHDFDPRQPDGIRIRGPVPQVNSCVAFDHVDHPACFQVDETGRVDRVVIPIRPQERRLTHAQLAHRPHSVRVVDEWGAVLDNGVHDRLPTHPELVSDLRHRTSEFTHASTRRRTGSARGHDLSIKELERFGPRPRSAQRFAATPPAVPDPQPGRAAEALRIADIDPHPILRLGPTTTRLAPRECLGRLDLDRHFTVGFAHASHAHTIKAEHRLGQPTTVSHRRDLVVVEAVEQLQRWRDPCTHRGTLTPSSLTSSTRSAS